MKEFLSQYKNENEKKFNKKLLKDIRMEPLVPFIVEIFKHLDNIPYFEFIGYEHIRDYTKMDLSKIEKKHAKGKVDEDYKMPIAESYLSKIIIKLRITCGKKTGIKEIPILIPELYNMHFYYISGKQYYPIYQLVDSSTYVAKGNVILKTMLLPIVVSRYRSSDDFDGAGFVYKYKLFKKAPLNILIYYMCQFGFQETLEFFDISDGIKLADAEDTYDSEFAIHHFNNRDFSIKYHRELYKNSDIFRNMVLTLIDLLTECKKMNRSHLEDKKKWVYQLGLKFTSGNKPKSDAKVMSKGENTLISFRRLLDNITKNALRLKELNKKDVFHITKWIIYNYDSLKQKNSLDLINKRLRLNEYIAGYLYTEINTKVNRILLKDGLNYQYIERQMNMEVNKLITKLAGSQLLQYDGAVNDMDILSALKFTSKGPNSLGSSNTRNINMKYKAIHYSHIGRIDICSGSANSIGVTGMLTPFVKTDGLYFTEEEELQEGDFKLFKAKQESELYPNFLSLDFDSEEDYNDYLAERKEMTEKIKEATRELMVKF